jgi:S1-C subfamily serine protease
MLLAPLPANWAQAGVIVLALDSNSPAAQQGIRQGSIITSVAGKLISNLEQLRQIVRIAPSQQYPLQSIEGTERVAASK